MSAVRDDDIENVRSTARDHLANERTFLAWVRTALGIMGFGVLLEKLTESQGWIATLEAVVLVSYGALILVYSIYRYKVINERLREGRFPVAKQGPFLIALLAILVMIGAMFMVLN